MGTNYNPRIVTDGLQFCVDSGNIKSYPGSGSTQTNLVSNLSSTDGAYSNIPALIGLSGFTGFCVLDILGTDTAYAYQPISKWNNGTTDASFVLYHFQQYNDNFRTNDLAWYANAGGTWTDIGSKYDTTVGRYISTIQYNSSLGGKHYINGTDSVGRSSARGLLGSGTGNLLVDGHLTGRAGIHKVLYTALYNRELNDDEIVMNHYVLKRRFNI